MPKLSTISKILPALLIPDADQELLRDLATTLVTHNVEQFNTLHVCKGGHPDSRVWLPTRKIEGIRIYREVPNSTPPSIPSLLLLGSVVGKLDDIMYGVMAPTDEALKIKSSCIRDGVLDNKVLEELEVPNAIDPFHSVTVQWRLYDDRDYVTLDSTGIMETRWGERVGYNVSHSVEFPQFPSFTSLDIVRGNMSVCSLYRQKTSNTIECFTRGFFDVSTTTPRNAAPSLQSIATRWLSFSRNMECAQMKKLAWRLRKNAGDSESFELAPVRPKQKPTDPACRVCLKSFSFIPGMRKTCKSCNHAVCSRCCVKKVMSVMVPDQCSILGKKRTFCSMCIHEVVQSDAVGIARDEIKTRRVSYPQEYSL
ncbi:hypothetical protein PHYBOEH_003883 [Phytophthora boehmeriae]|uniref:FYVE-type domain-containing protein n=1 Tax=Phytophthora boehmeriae TaxID=109152 RepID=A0A8T1WU21_9STRA|nr:hypothetical protein PHYBOEH_003883 [Phytophthora boehmeriae]